MHNTVGLRHWLQSGLEELVKLVQDLKEKQKQQQTHSVVIIIPQCITSVMTAWRCIFMADFALVCNNVNKTMQRDVSQEMLFLIK